MLETKVVFKYSIMNSTCFIKEQIHMFLDNKRIIAVSCGQSFTVALTEDGEVTVYYFDTTTPLF